MKDLKRLQPKKILVRMPNWIGDLVMAIPILQDLKERFPQSELTAMCKATLVDLLKHNPYIDEVFSFKNNKGMFFRREEHRNVIRKLHTGSYDLGMLLTNSLSSAWCFWQGNVKFRIGYKGDFRSSLLTHPIAFPAGRECQHLVLTYKKLLEPLGIETSSTVPSLVVLEEDLVQAYGILARYGVNKDHHIIGINPGAAYGSAKCWLPERFEGVTQKLLDINLNIRVVFFGDHQGASLVKTICQKFSSRVVNLAGQTNLRELMSLIKICNVFLTNDSGPMHIADALGTRLLALFGSTNSVATGPFIQKNILRKEVKCSPCYKRVCPIDFRCMKSIHTDEVYEKLKELLDRNIHVEQD